MEEQNTDLQSVRKVFLNIFKGNGVFVFPNGDICGDLDGTKISVISALGWEQLDCDPNLTVKDLIPEYVIQEVDICELLDQHMKSVGLKNFLQFSDPTPLSAYRRWRLRDG
jgi:hypothetical protein